MSLIDNYGYLLLFFNRVVRFIYDNLIVKMFKFCRVWGRYEGDLNVWIVIYIIKLFFSLFYGEFFFYF